MSILFGHKLTWPLYLGVKLILPCPQLKYCLRNCVITFRKHLVLVRFVTARIEDAFLLKSMEYSLMAIVKLLPPNGILLDDCEEDDLSKNP